MTTSPTATLKVEKMVHGARALARLPDGQVVLVRGGLPGETVQAHLRGKSGVLHGDIHEVLTPSPHRIDASPHPGLDYSFIQYDYQLTLKQAVVQDALQRALGGRAEGVLEPLTIPPPSPAPDIWHYRHTIQPAIADNALGYRTPETHDIIPLSHDPTALKSLTKAWQTLKEHLPLKGVREVVLRSNEAGEVLACFIASASAKNYLKAAHNLIRAGITGISYAPYDARGRFRGGSERLAGKRSIKQHYGPFYLTMNITSFAQPNVKAATKLYEALHNVVKALPERGDHALDLFAGSGMIALHLSDLFGTLTALEIDKGSVVRGEQDIRDQGVHNLSLIKADAKQIIHHELLSQVTTITVDPPRTGLAKPLREALIGSQARTLIYVSCDVATWARDVAHFTEQGFALTHVQPFDFYPHTHHIEILSVLERS